MDSHVISQADLETLHRNQAAGGGGRSGRPGERRGERAQPRVHPRPRAHRRTHLQSSARRRQPGQAGSTLLTTIVTLNPIRFVFDSPESALLKYKRAQSSAAADNPVDIRLQDETDYRWKGHIEFIDNALDEGSGTIRARALVDNPTGFLMPGMFGHMRLFRRTAGRKPC